MSAPAATKARIRAILERLKLWIETALTDAGYTSYYVTMDHTQLATNTSTMPYVSIKVDPAMIDAETYDRLLPHTYTLVGSDYVVSATGKGMMATYFFKLHVHQLKNTGSGEDENRDAQICARHIMDYCLGRSQLDAEVRASGINRVFDVAGRESNPAKLFNVSRIIVAGTLWVIRLDSPP